MGGKTWQEVEERLFWQVLVPLSPEALDPSDRKYSWGDISAIMKEELGHLHFRKYTCQLICESISTVMLGQVNKDQMSTSTRTSEANGCLPRHATM